MRGTSQARLAASAALIAVMTAGAAPVSPADAASPAADPWDVNGDGFADLVIGVPDEDSVDGVEREGRNGCHPLARLTQECDQGAVLVLPGSPAGPDPGRARTIIAGVDDVPITRGESSAFGSVLAAGDLDGDGVDELVIGSPGDETRRRGRDPFTARTWNGSVTVLPGSSDGPTGTGSEVITSAATGVRHRQGSFTSFGGALSVLSTGASAGADLVIGAKWERVTEGRAGVVVVFPGGDGLIDRQRRVVLSQATPGVIGGSEQGDAFGQSIGN